MASFLLRFGLAFTFCYTAFNLFRNPQEWIGYFPRELIGLVEMMSGEELGWDVLGFHISNAGEFFLFQFIVFQLILAIWLVSGFLVKVSAIFAAVTFFFIIVFNLDQIGNLFWAVGLLFAALALAIVGRSR